MIFSKRVGFVGIRWRGKLQQRRAHGGCCHCRHLYQLVYTQILPLSHLGDIIFILTKIDWGQIQLVRGEYPVICCRIHRLPPWRSRGKYNSQHTFQPATIITLSILESLLQSSCPSVYHHPQGHFIKTRPHHHIFPLPPRPKAQSSPPNKLAQLPSKYNADGSRNLNVQLWQLSKQYDTEWKWNAV